MLAEQMALSFFSHFSGSSPSRDLRLKADTTTPGKDTKNWCVGVWVCVWVRVCLCAQMQGSEGNFVESGFSLCLYKVSGDRSPVVTVLGQLSLPAEPLHQP